MDRSITDKQKSMNTGCEPRINWAWLNEPNSFRLLSVVILMNVTLTIPETIFEQASGEIARELLERGVLEAFRAGAISLGRVTEILDLTIDEANGFLKAHKVSSEITTVDIEEGRAVIKSLLSQ